MHAVVVVLILLVPLHFVGGIIMMIDFLRPFLPKLSILTVGEHFVSMIGHVRRYRPLSSHGVVLTGRHGLDVFPLVGGNVTEHIVE
jgi:hypothetical protein